METRIVNVSELINKDILAGVIPEQVITVLKKLNGTGYIVGGAVRDLILNKEIKDWDIATSLNHAQIKELFPTADEVGASFGVFKVPVDGMIIDVARFRVDSSYTDGRHPDDVTYTSSIEEDLLRRDFTVNAMALYVDFWRDKVYSYKVFGTSTVLQDLKDTVLRTVGSPETRLTEDPVRILRAFRFCSEKGFSIEPVTKGMCFRLVKRLYNVAPERVFSEFARLLKGDYAAETLRMMRDLRVLEQIIPEVRECFYCGQNPKWHDLTVFEHMIATLHNLPKDTELRLAGFFHDIGKPRTMFFNGNSPHFYGGEGAQEERRHEEVSADIVEKVLSRWNCSKSLINNVKGLVSNHMHRFLTEPTAKSARRFYALTGDTAERQITLRRADGLAKDRALLLFEYEILGLRKFLATAKERATALKVTDLAIDGKIVMETFGGKQGPMIGIILKECLDEVVDNPTMNTVENLVEFIIKRDRRS